MTDKQPEEALLKAVTKAFGPDGEPTAFDASTWSEIHGAITWMLDENRRLHAANTPPQRKPLTDEEIESLYESTESVNWGRSFARAIEAAHGIHAAEQLKGDA